MAPKVLVTRMLPPQTQARLSGQDFELIQWQEDSPIPRHVLLEQVQGKFVSCVHEKTSADIYLFLVIGVDALFCLLTEKIDDQVLDAAGKPIVW
jgi:glyoxylate/hydroxypyruvate reductase